MKIIMICAMAANRVIGESTTNDIPWYVPGEQLRFKNSTMGHPLIMGRKTYESIGRPLPGRQMVVITRNHNFSAPGVLVAHSPAAALNNCKGAVKVFIVGGEEIYRLHMPSCDEIILTTLQREVKGDIFFPALPAGQFELQKQETIKHPEQYVIETYRRI